MYATTKNKGGLMACIAKRRGRYVIDFYDNHGKRRWKTLPEGTTKKKAKDELREIESCLNKGSYLPDGKVPTFSKVAGDWLEFKRINLRLSTWDSYAGHVNKHFETLNPIKINRITTVMVEKYIAEKREENRLKLSTLKAVIVTLSQVMKYAIKHRYIDFNPVTNAEKPKTKGKNDKKPMRVLHPDEINWMPNRITDIEHFTDWRYSAEQDRANYWG